MMQLWLVALGAVLLWRADEIAGSGLVGWPEWTAIALALAGWCLLAGSVVLTFVAGGTVG